MWRNARIAVVVPAFREERLIERTLASIPAWVDAIVVVDDASPDRTAELVQSLGEQRTHLVRHPENRGVGAAIVSGYQRALELGADVVAVMAGDAQMDPADLPAVIGPVVEGAADYVKGNRFRHARASDIPRLRRAGGTITTLITRAATGLAIDDAQCGYTAISARAIRALPLAELWPRYGYPNDLLSLAARAKLSVAEVPVRPLYADEASGVRPWHVLVIAAIVGRRALQRVTRPIAIGVERIQAERAPTQPYASGAPVVGSAKTRIVPIPNPVHPVSARVSS